MRVGGWAFAKYEFSGTVKCPAWTSVLGPDRSSTCSLQKRKQALHKDGPCEAFVGSGVTDQVIKKTSVKTGWQSSCAVRCGQETPKPHDRIAEQEKSAHLGVHQGSRIHGKNKGGSCPTYSHSNHGCMEQHLLFPCCSIMMPLH